MALLIDVSGSMRGSLPAMAKAAHTVVQELAKQDTQGTKVRFSVVRFDSESTINTKWTTAPSTVAAGLGDLSAFTGQNDSRAAFDDLKSLLRDARPDARKAAVFYTDGALARCPDRICPGGPMTKEEIREAAAALREEGVEIYSVGPPDQPRHPLMRQMTGTPSRVYKASSLKDLTRRFRRIADTFLPRIGSNGRLTNRLDGRYFSVGSMGPSWTLGRNGTLEREIPTVPARDVTYKHGIEPRASGLWRVGINVPERVVPKLSFATLGGSLRTLEASYQPRLLVIGWLALLLGLLPALLWTLLFLRQRPSHDSPEQDLPPPVIPQRQFSASRLPTLPEESVAQDPPVPTLFIGLGGAGREGLRAVRNDLKQAHLDEAGHPYDFLHLDLDDAEESSDDFDHWEAYPIHTLRAPTDVRRTRSYMPGRSQFDSYLRWFPAKRYRGAPNETLNLNNGAREERALARLALFRWLGKEIREEHPSDQCLFPVLEEHMETLLSHDSPDGTRQVVVFASKDGGTGSGWVVDIGRLLRRIARRKQRAGEIEFVPEMIAVLLGSDEHHRPESRDALDMELESAALAGAFPQMEAYIPDDDQEDHPDGDLLIRRDTEPPYNYILNVSAVDTLSAAAQGAEVGGVIVRRQARSGLLEQVSALRSHPTVDVQAKGLHTHPTRLLEHVSHGLLMRLMGPDVLIDADTNPDSGGFQFRSISSDVKQQQLKDWGQSGPSLWRRLVLAACEPSHTDRWLHEVEKHQNGGALQDPVWFARTLRTSVSQRLHGQHDSDRRIWVRNWTPSEAVGALKLFASRIENDIRPRVQEEEPLAILERVQTAAEEAARSLEAWGTACCELLTEEAQRLNQAEDAVETLNDVGQRKYVDPALSPEAVDKLVEECLEQWLERPDAGSVLRERLFPTLRLKHDEADDDEVEVVVRSFIDESVILETPEEVIDALSKKSNALAHLTPSLHIGEALNQQSEEAREEQAQWLVEGQKAPDQVLVMAPSAEATREASETSFVERIPQPAEHGERRDRLSDDGSAIRRVGLSRRLPPDSPEELHLIESAEQTAENLRARAKEEYKLQVPSFPPALRRALTDTVPFRSFARAYEAGRITEKEDEAGTAQWYFNDQDAFLTFDPDDTLADAAANYVWYVPDPPKSLDGRAPNAFHRLKQWRKGNIDHLDEDILTMIAIDVIET